MLLFIDLHLNYICKSKLTSSLLLYVMEPSLSVSVFVVDIYLKRATVV